MTTADADHQTRVEPYLESGAPISIGFRKNRPPLERGDAQSDTRDRNDSTISRYGRTSRTPDAGSDRIVEDEDPLVDAYDHHQARSSASTIFLPTELTDPQKRKHFESLKAINDGTRDKDRQQWEGVRDKNIWADAYGTYLSLPRHLIREAQQLLTDLDLRQMGKYNDLHVCVLATLTQAYRRFWLRRGYRRAEEVTDGSNPKRWCERDDFRTLWQELNLTEDALREASKMVNEKTSV